MKLREALAKVPDPRAHNQRYLLWGLLALILLAFHPVFPSGSSCPVDSLRGVARFAQANPHLFPDLGLREPPGHHTVATLLHQLAPQALRQALLSVFS